MEITNLNFLTLFTFLSVLSITVYGTFLMYKKLQKLNSLFKGLNKNNKLNFIKYIFLLLSFVILLPSIFGIKTTGKISSNENEGINIVFVLDVSKSMNVADIESKNYIYTRLDFAKSAIENFVVNHNENNYSLVIFAGESSSVVPLTNNHNFFLSTLNNVDYRNISIQGTNFYEALLTSHNRLIISEDKSNAIIFISDGGDDGDLFIEGLRESNYEDLKNENIKYYIAGIGTEEGGKIITGRDFFGRLTYQTYNNEYVITKLNENNLKQLSNVLDGTYQKLEDYSDIELFSKSLDKIEKKVIESNSTQNGVDASRKLGFISFVFFFTYLVLYLFGDKIYFFIYRDE